MKFLRFYLNYVGNAYDGSGTLLDSNVNISQSWDMMDGDSIEIMVWNTMGIYDASNPTFSNYINCWGDFWYRCALSNQTANVPNELSFNVWKITCRYAGTEPYLEISDIGEIISRKTGGAFIGNEAFCIKGVVHTHSRWDSDFYAEALNPMDLNGFAMDVPAKQFDQSVGIMKRPPVMKLGRCNGHWSAREYIRDKKTQRRYTNLCDTQPYNSTTFANILHTLETTSINGSDSGYHCGRPGQGVDYGDGSELWVGEPIPGIRGANDRLSIVKGVNNSSEWNQNGIRETPWTSGWWWPSKRHNYSDPVPPITLNNDSCLDLLRPFCVNQSTINNVLYKGGSSVIWKILSIDNSMAARFKAPEVYDAHAIIPAMMIFHDRITAQDFENVVRYRFGTVGFVGQTGPVFMLENGTDYLGVSRTLKRLDEDDGTWGLIVNTMISNDPSQIKDPHKVSGPIECMITPSFINDWPSLDIFGWDNDTQSGACAFIYNCDIPPTDTNSDPTIVNIFRTIK